MFVMGMCVCVHVLHYLSLCMRVLCTYVLCMYALCTCAHAQRSTYTLQRAVKMYTLNYLLFEDLPAMGTNRVRQDVT